MAFSADGKRLVSGGDQAVKVWDAATGQEALTLKGHTGHVAAVAFSADGKRLVSGGGDGLGDVMSVAFSADGKRLVSGGGDKTVKVWDAAAGQETLALKGHTSWVTSVACSADGKRLVSGSADGTVKVWDAATGQEALTRAMARFDPFWHDDEARKSETAADWYAAAFHRGLPRSPTGNFTLKIQQK